MLCYALQNDAYFSSHRILLIEKNKKQKNDRTWCFWEKGQGQWDEIIHHQWESAAFKNKGFQKIFSLSPYTYKMIRGIDFYRFCDQKLQKAKNITVVEAEIDGITTQGENTLVSTSKGEFSSPAVFSSLPTENYKQQKRYPVLQQHFIGWFIQSEQPLFNPKKVEFMDFTVPQNNNTRFMYVLPFSEHEALVEYTLFSPTLLEEKEYENAIEDYLEREGIGKYTVTEKEQGSIPMTAYNFSQHNTASLLHIGTSGGWTKASTGFTFQKTHRKIEELIGFLKTGKPLHRFEKRTKFHFYDLLFLDVLAQHNGEGHFLFQRMFERNHPQRIFSFLDETTRFWEEIKIMLSFPIGRFVYALFRRLFGL